MTAPHSRAHPPGLAPAPGFKLLFITMDTPTTPPRHVRRFLLRGLATGLLFAQSAFILPAQTTPAVTTNEKDPDGTDKVLVLEKFTVQAGFSGSLAAAAQAKQNSQNIVEVIMSEDIGKLPDVSIADSLTRLTGVAMQRTNGRSQNISVRGLTGDFVSTTLNGREQVSTNMNRGVEFDQYPSELLNQVVVYKTAGANLTSQGIGGTVDLITVQPLSKTGRTVAVSAYYKTTQLGLLTPGVDKNGESYSVSYVDQNKDGTFGVALGYAHTLTPFEGQQFQAWGYPTSGGNFFLGGTKSYVRSSNLRRDGLMGVFEFKPNANVHSTVDVYYSDFQEKQVLRGMELPLEPSWGAGTTIGATTITNNLATSAVYQNVHPVLRNDSYIRNNTLFSAGWNLQLNEKSAWPIIFDAGYSRISRKDKNLELWAGLGFQKSDAGDTMTVQLSPGRIPQITKTLDYTNTSLIKLTDPEGWGNSPIPGGAGPGYFKGFDALDELGQFKLITKHELNHWFKDVEIGVAYTDRFKRDGEKPSGWEYLANGAQTAPFPTVIGITDMSFLGITGGIAAFDPFKPFSDGTLGFFPNPDTGIVANRFNVREKIFRPYVEFGIDTKMGSVPVTGNLGLQANIVDQSSHGLSANGSTVNAVNDGSKYTDLAPSLNLNFMPRERTYIRFSVARQIARPRMFDMKASRTWSYNPINAGATDLKNSPWSGSGGNPKLKPWKSDSIDLAFDKYFKDNKGYFSTAFFYKKLRNYIYESTTLQDFTGFPITPAGGPEPVLRQGTVTTPFNGNGGSIKGAEATLSLPSELISSAIRGFGVVLGGAYTDSSIEPWGPGHGTTAINGLSKRVYNITAYYERKGFGARISQHYRSAYRAFTTNFGVPTPKGDVAPNGDFSETQAETIVDAQVSYALQSGSLKGLTFYVQAYNLGNEPLVTFDNGDPRQVKNYQKYGASYNFGASYKF